ncbi:MAG: hypothetical protein CMO64_03785 [Verrucomicrobiales bacterium]|nr:hypothetical protein [Verrucomicrobiales bacterium]|tara:strand:+ start:2308 stop:3051 length:744 start_codon:yes stop_codon:yes gene_type:complete
MNTNLELDRRHFLGLATGAGVLTLRADAPPTPATPDAHEYVSFLKAKGDPTVSPEGKWKPTHADILGPFWASGAPYRGKVTPPLEPGKLLVVRGRVWSHRTKEPLAKAVLDVWQADAKGRYDFQDHPVSEPRALVGGRQPKKADFRNRIRLVTDEEGYYEYETIKPASYRAGQQVRPSHIHYMAHAPGHSRLITQLYFKGDPAIAGDSFGKNLGAANSPLIIATKNVKTPNGQYMSGTFDLVLAAGA